MTFLIGSLDVTDTDDGYYMEIVEGDPITAIPEVTGARVTIPGRVGLYTPDANFEDRKLLIRIHAFVAGEGSTHEAQVSSFATAMAALKTACGVADRADVTLTWNGWTIPAGFLRFEGPPVVGDMAREFDIHFEATDPPEWTLTGS